MFRCVTFLFASAVSLPAFSSDVTFSKNVAPVLYKRCVACHHKGDIAPMSLLTYKQARPWARAIREAVRLRKMPPWHADPHYGDFENDHRLSDAEIATITLWVDQGGIEGNPKELPDKPQFTEGWRIGKPDMVFPIPADYKVAANAPDQYLYFKVPTNFKEDVWIQAVELRPGNRKVVHHAHVFIAKPAITESATTKQPASKNNFTIKDGAVSHINPDMPVVDDGCASPDGGNWPGRKPSENGGMLGSFLPGKEPDVFPAGYARKIPAGSVIEFQVHYHALSNDELDRTSVGLLLAKEPPKQQLRRIDISNFLFQIPAGDPNHKVTACYTLPNDVEMMSYTAHMHLRGKNMMFEAVHPNGRRETLLSVPKYDFNWQTEYKLKRPVALERGTKIVITAHFDNSANNPNNPDPTKTIRWGEPSYEEMTDGWFEYILPTEQPKRSANNERSPI
jgi:hypothetical protein